MASLIDAYEFKPATFTPSKRTTFEEALKSVDPLIQSTAKSIGDYNSRTARQTEINDAIAAGNAGWYDENDPATVAAVEEYVRTGNSGTLQNLKNAWQNSQDRINAEAKAALEKVNAQNAAQEANDAAWVDKKFEENQQAKADELNSEFLRAWQTRPDFAKEYKKKGFKNAADYAASWDAAMNAAYGDAYVNKAISDEELTRMLQSYGVKITNPKKPRSKWGD